MPISPKDLALFSGTVGDLMTDGNRSFVECLSVAADQRLDKRFHNVMQQVISDVKQGCPLSLAMIRHPRFFAKTYIAMVREGEETGTLEDVLQHIGSGGQEPGRA